MRSFFTLPFRLILASMALAASLPLASAASPVSTQDASAPVPRPGIAHFYRLHASFLDRAKEGPINLLFLGDSITEGWKNARHVWKSYYGDYEAANFGIAGDETQHVIWRIEDGELNRTQPKVIVLMLGTNNSAKNTGEEIAAANKKIIEMIHARLPETKVLLLAIFPRGPRPRDGNPDTTIEQRLEAIRVANAELAKLDDGDRVRFLDIGAVFLGPDGKIPGDVMPDQLHLSVKGYKLWAEAMDPLLTELMR